MHFGGLVRLLLPHLNEATPLPTVSPGVLVVTQGTASASPAVTWRAIKEKPNIKK
jgi:hypothetical protein